MSTYLPTSPLRQQIKFLLLLSLLLLLFVQNLTKSQIETKAIDFEASFEGNDLMPLTVFMGKINVSLFERTTMLDYQSSFFGDTILVPSGQNESGKVVILRIQRQSSWRWLLNVIQGHSLERETEW